MNMLQHGTESEFRLEIHSGIPEAGTPSEQNRVAQLVLRERRAGRWRLATGVDACILSLGSPLLAGVLQRAQTGGYRLRSTRDSPPLRRLWEHASAPAVRSPGDAPADAPGAEPEQCGAIRYPIVFWLSPLEPEEADSAVRRSLDAPEQRERFEAAVRAGSIWVSIADVFLDVIGSPAAMELALTWFQAAEEASGIPLYWKTEDPI